MLHFRGWFLNHLIESGHDAKIIAPDRGSKKKSRKYLELCKFQVSLVHACLGSRAPLFISYTLLGNFFVAMWCSIFRKHHVVVVTGIGSFLYGNSKAKAILVFLLRLFYRQSTRFLFMNDENRKYYRKLFGIDINKCGFLPGEGISNECSESAVTDRSDVTIFDRKDFNIVFVGRLLKDKGIYDFIDMAKRCPDLQFYIYGDVDSNNPTSLTEDEMISYQDRHNLHFQGHTKNVDQVLSQADMLILPSYHEGFPTILSEATVLGKEFLTSDAVGCIDFVKYVGVGTVYPVGDVSSAVLKIAEIRNNAVFYDHVKAGVAKERVSQNAILEFYKKEIGCI